MGLYGTGTLCWSENGDSNEDLQGEDQTDGVGEVVGSW